MLRRALAESMKRVKVMATEETVDRRIVVKLLTTYFERGHSPEVLQLMSRMLGFSGAPCSQILMTICWAFKARVRVRLFGSPCQPSIDSQQWRLASACSRQLRLLRLLIYTKDRIPVGNICTSRSLRKVLL